VAAVAGAAAGEAEAAVRRALVLALLLPATAAAGVRLGPDRPVDAPMRAPAFGDQLFGAIAYGAGEYLIGWLSGGSLNQVAWAARMKPDGTVLDDPPLLLTANDGPFQSDELSVAFDGTRFAAVFITPSQGVLARFIGTDGTLGAPIPIFNASPYQEGAVIAGGDGHFLIAWTTVPMPNETHVRGAILDDDGTLHPDFPISLGSYDLAPSLTWGGPGNRFLCVYEHSYQVWAARIDGLGNVEAPFRINDGTLDPYTTAWASASSTGNEFLVHWSDDRGLYAGTAIGPELWGRMVPLSGTPAATDFQIAPLPAGAVGGDYGVAIQSVAVGGEYLAFWSFLVDGRASQISSAGVVASPGGVLTPFQIAYQDHPIVASDGKVAMVGIDEGFDSFTGRDVYARPVDAQTLAAGARELVTQGENYQLARSLACNGNVFLLVWSDNRFVDGSEHIYGRRFDSAGAPLDAKPFAISTTPGAQFLPAVAAVPGGDFLVVWTDASDDALYANRVGASGAPKDGQGFQLHAPSSIYASAATAPALAANDKGWLVAWEDWRLGYADVEVWSVLVGADGGLGSERRVASGADSTRPACAPAVVWNGLRWLVAFEQPCAIRDTTTGSVSEAANLYGRWLDPHGIPLIGQPLPLVITSVDTARSPALASDGAGTTFLAWTTGTAVLAATLANLDDGTPSAAVAIASSRGTIRESPQVAWSGGGVPLTFSWVSRSPLGIEAQRTDATLAPIGDKLALSSLAPYLGSVGAYFGSYWAGVPRVTPPAPLAVATGGGMLAAYEVMETLGGAVTPRVHLRAFGARARGEPCIAPGQCADGFCAGGVCCDVACDGACQACTAAGCVGAPPSDSRCGVVACGALTTTCRSYQDAANLCIAFNRCAEPGVAACTQFSDAPDGTACVAAGGVAGSCVGGDCAVAAPDGGSPRAPAGGCALAPGVAPGGWLLALVLLAALTRRRRIALLVLAAGVARAQSLPPDAALDAPVTVASPGNHDEPSIAFGAGEYLAVWADRGTTIRGVRLQPDGTLLDKSPIIIGDEGGAIDTPAVGFDGNRFLVVWYAAVSGYALHAAYVDRTGFADAPFTLVPTQSFHPVVAAGNGHSLAVWAQYPGPGIAGQLFDQDGPIGNGLVLTSSTDITHPAAGFAPSAGSFLVAWGEGTPKTLMSAQVAVDGTIAPAVRLDDPTVVNNAATDPSIASDGSNFLVAWLDQRNAPAPSLYGRVVPAGGAPAANDFALAMNAVSPELTFVGGNYLLLWGGYGGERISTSGALLDGAGVTFGMATFDQYWSASVVASDGKGAMVVTPGAYALTLDVANMKQVGSTLLASGENTELSPALATDGRVFLLVWVDTRPGSGVYGLRFDANGKPLDGAALRIGINGVQPALAALPDGDFLVAWADGTSIWGRRVPSSGAPRDANPFLISTSSFTTGGSAGPTVAAGPDGWLVAWENYDLPGDNNGDFGSTISSALVSSDGAVGPTLPITAGETSCEPAAVWNGTRYFVAFEDPCGAEGPRGYPSPPPNGDLFGRWLGADGVGMLDSVPISNNPLDSERQPRAALGPAGNVLVVWETNHSSISAALIADAGVAPAVVSPIVADLPTRDAPSVTFTAGSGLVAWIDQNPLAVRAVRIDAGLNPIGAPLTLSSAPPFVAPDLPFGRQYNFAVQRETPAAVAALPSGAALVAYGVVDTFADQSYSRIHYRTLGLRTAGEPCGGTTDCASGICTGGVCCAVSCDGVCQACSARGCVETPASDPRCGAGQLPCSSLSTDCRVYDDAPQIACASFNRCASAGGLDQCLRYTDAPDGTPCHDVTLGDAAGVCRAGSCALAEEPIAPAIARATPGCGCEVGGAAPAPLAVLALLGLALSVPGRRRGRPCAIRRRPPRRRDNRPD
jgi:MYXO-CTERM domain-containing protein